jgi:four helix bundle protein
MQSFRELKVWNRAHVLVLAIYKATATFPNEERFGLTSQLRRAAASVAANIAEGSKRRTNPQYAQFLNIAEGSLAETDYFLLLCHDLAYLSDMDHRRLAEEVDQLSRMLNTLRAKVEQEA